MFTRGYIPDPSFGSPMVAGRGFNFPDLSEAATSAVYAEVSGVHEEAQEDGRNGREKQKWDLTN